MKPTSLHTQRLQQQLTLQRERMLDLKAWLFVWRTIAGLELIVGLGFWVAYLWEK